MSSESKEPIAISTTKKNIYLLRDEKDEDDILTMFPASKNFPQEISQEIPKDILDDPLEYLLNEFSANEFPDIPEEVPEEEEISRQNNIKIRSKKSHKQSEKILSNTQLTAHLKILCDTTKRLKYYLDEIENVAQDLSCHERKN